MGWSPMEMLDEHGVDDDTEETDHWGSYECVACHIVFEVRFSEDTPRSKHDAIAGYIDGEAHNIVRCPLCGELKTLEAQWSATEGGYGSTSEKDALIETLKMRLNGELP